MEQKIGVGTYLVSRVFDDRRDIKSVVASYIVKRMEDDGEKFDDTSRNMV